MTTNHPEDDTQETSQETVSESPEPAQAAEEAVVAEPIFEEDDTPEMALIDDAEELRQQVEALTQERDELRDQMLRARADFDNYRKRMMREQENARAQAAKALLGDLLPVLDHLEMAVAHGDDDSGGLREGVQMTAKQLNDVLAKHGCVPIESTGAVFNPELHEAMMQSSSDEMPEGYVVSEFQRGYRLGDIVLRHARVIVSTGPESAEAPSE
jgi:molecular chaperone GrpE